MIIITVKLYKSPKSYKMLSAPFSLQVTTAKEAPWLIIQLNCAARWSTCAYERGFGILTQETLTNTRLIMLIGLHLWGRRKRSMRPQNISNCFKKWTSIFNWAKHDDHKRKWKKLKCSHMKRCSIFRVRNLKTKTSRQLILKTAKSIWRKKSLTGKTGIITLAVWQFQVNLMKSYDPEILVSFQEKKLLHMDICRCAIETQQDSSL